MIENIPNEKIILQISSIPRGPSRSFGFSSFNDIYIFSFLKHLNKDVLKTSQNVFEREHLKVLNLIKKNLQK